MQHELLKAEIEHYETIRDELLGKARGQYALIHGRELIDTFASKDDAIKRGYELFGNVPFLVKRVSEMEEVLFFTSNLLAVE